MTELTVRETVDTTSGTNGEVTPHIRGTTKVQLVHGTARGLESLARVFGGDTASGGVSLGLRATLDLEALLVGEVEVDFGRRVGVNAIQKTNVTDVVQRNTHSDL